MLRTLAGVAFIAAVAAGAVYAWLRPTVARGHALAAILFDPDEPRKVGCDDDVPIDAAGATFQCWATAPDGSTALFDLAIDRDGAVKMALVSSTPATR